MSQRRPMTRVQYAVISTVAYLLMSAGYLYALHLLLQWRNTR